MRQEPVEGTVDAQGLKWAAVPKDKCEVPTAMNILLACYAVCFGE